MSALGRDAFVSQPGTPVDSTGADARGRATVHRTVDWNSPTSTAIHEAIRRGGGRIPFSQFMHICLYGRDGYYAHAKARIGVGRDFVTSAEVSPLFGATIGRQLAHTWTMMGRPETFQIIEMGAGTGALAHGLLSHARSSAPAFHSAIRYTILEYGGLIGQQRDRLRPLMTGERPATVRWVQGSASDLPVRALTGAIISNELTDAFPVERVTLVQGSAKQRYVASDGHDVLYELWGAPTEAVLDHLNEHRIGLFEGVEEPVNLHAARFQRHVGRALQRGIILTIDYGQHGEVGVAGRPAARLHGPRHAATGSAITIHPNDLRAAYQHPGEVDITASVNFAPLERIARADGLRVVFSGTQRDFLLSSGIEDVLVVQSHAQLSPLRARCANLIRASRATTLCDPATFGGFYAHLLARDVPGLTMRHRSSAAPSRQRQL